MNIKAWTKAWTLAILLLLAVPSAAEFHTVELAHEVRLADLRLPQSESGTVGFRDCDECDYQSASVTAETRWTINGKSMRLDDFRVRLARIVDRGDVYVTVLHHLEEDRVTEVSVRLP